MILTRYLLREIVKPFGVVLAVLVILFTSYGAARFLSHAVNGLLPTDLFAQLVALRSLIALDVLIPISLYLAVILSFGKLYSDSEITALFALGSSPQKVFSLVVVVSTCIAAVVGGLSLAVRPWAYARSHELSNRASASLNTKQMKAGTFYVSSDGNRTIFIQRRRGRAAPGRDVFVELHLKGGTRVIYARSAEQRPTLAPGSGSVMHLTGAHVYDIGRGSAVANLVMNVSDLVIRLPNPQITPPQYSSVAAGTAHLMASHSAADIAELEWRLSTPWSTLLLGMLAVPLSRVQPRQHRQAKMGIAILIYAGYYFLYESARTWVQNGVIRTVPGVWLAPIALSALLLAVWVGPQLHLRRHLRRRRT